MQGLSLGLGKGMWKGEAGKVYSCEYQDEVGANTLFFPAIGTNLLFLFIF